MKRILLLALVLLALIPVGALADGAAAQTGEQTDVQTEYRTLERGSDGEDVQALMQRLADLGYYTSSVDDMFGPGMARAVQLFNAQHGLGNSEVATAQTQQMAFA